jgi:hypothetical protein
VLADLPHTAFQSVVLPQRGLTDSRHRLSASVITQLGRGDGSPPLNPCAGLRQYSLRAFPMDCPSLAAWGPSSGDSPEGHCRWIWLFIVGELRESTDLHPFAPPALPGLNATMGALTPGRPALRLDEHEHRLCRRPGLSASCAWPSDHSDSNHPSRSTIAFARYPSASWTSGSPRSGLRHWLAGSPRVEAESSSLAFRTGRSPPVASHPLSRGRSYFRFQAGERVP